MCQRIVGWFSGIILQRSLVRDRWWGRLIFDVLVVLMEGRVKHLTGRAMVGLYQEAGFADIEQFRRGGPAPFLLTIGRAVKPAQVQRMAA